MIIKCNEWTVRVGLWAAVVSITDKKTKFKPRFLSCEVQKKINPTSERFMKLFDNLTIGSVHSSKLKVKYIHK